MQVVFSELAFKILPLYLLILFGFIAGKYIRVDRKSIAGVLFYIIIPYVFFEYGMRTEIHLQHLMLPVIFFVISTILSFSYLFIAKQIWKNDARPNVIAFSAGTGNTGYFGLPVALMLFDDQTIGIYMLMNIGLSFYDYSVGAFVMARGKYSSKDALVQVSRLPMLYAFLAGLLLNELGYKFPDEFRTFGADMKGAYVVLGMMVIGLGLSTVRSFDLNTKFISVLLSAKFIAAPIMILLLIYSDQYYFHLFSEQTHLAMLLLAFVPPAANTVVFASIHECHPEETATAILIGTIIGMFYMPAMLSILF